MRMARTFKTMSKNVKELGFFERLFVGFSAALDEAIGIDRKSPESDSRGLDEERREESEETNARNRDGADVCILDEAIPGGLSFSDSTDDEHSPRQQSSRIEASHILEILQDGPLSKKEAVDRLVSLGFPVSTSYRALVPAKRFASLVEISPDGLIGLRRD